MVLVPWDTKSGDVCVWVGVVIHVCGWVFCDARVLVCYACMHVCAHVCGCVVQAMRKLHQLEVFGSRLVVEFAESTHLVQLHRDK